MQPRHLLVFTLLLLIAGMALAADISGKWIAQVPGRDGTPRENTFQFKAEGDKLSGTVDSGRGGPAAIADGKISGDSVSFTLTREFNGNTIKWTYSGMVSGNEIKFKRTGGQGEPREFTAKRAQ